MRRVSLSSDAAADGAAPQQRTGSVREREPVSAARNDSGGNGTARSQSYVYADVEMWLDREVREAAADEARELYSAKRSRAAVLRHANGAAGSARPGATPDDSTSATPSRRRATRPSPPLPIVRPEGGADGASAHSPPFALESTLSAADLWRARPTLHAPSRAAAAADDSVPPYILLDESGERHVANGGDDANERADGNANGAADLAATATRAIAVTDAATSDGAPSAGSTAPAAAAGGDGGKRASRVGAKRRASSPSLSRPVSPSNGGGGGSGGAGTKRRRAATLPPWQLASHLAHVIEELQTCANEHATAAATAATSGRADTAKAVARDAESTGAEDGTGDGHTRRRGASGGARHSSRGGASAASSLRHGGSAAARRESKSAVSASHQQRQRQHPLNIDFSELARKAADGAYDSIEAFTADLSLLVSKTVRNRDTATELRQKAATLLKRGVDGGTREIEQREAPPGRRTEASEAAACDVDTRCNVAGGGAAAATDASCMFEAGVRAKQRFSQLVHAQMALAFGDRDAFATDDVGAVSAADDATDGDADEAYSGDGADDDSADDDDDGNTTHINNCSSNNDVDADLTGAANAAVDERQGRRRRRGRRRAFEYVRNLPRARPEFAHALTLPDASGAMRVPLRSVVARDTPYMLPPAVCDGVARGIDAGIGCGGDADNVVDGNPGGPHDGLIARNVRAIDSLRRKRDWLVRQSRALSARDGGANVRNDTRSGSAAAAIVRPAHVFIGAPRAPRTASASGDADNDVAAAAAADDDGDSAAGDCSARAADATPFIGLQRTVAQLLLHAGFTDVQRCALDTISELVGAFIARHGRQLGAHRASGGAANDDVASPAARSASFLTPQTNRCYAGGDTGGSRAGELAQMVGACGFRGGFADLILYRNEELPNMARALHAGTAKVEERVEAMRAAVAAAGVSRTGASQLADGYSGGDVESLNGVPNKRAADHMGAADTDAERGWHNGANAASTFADAMATAAADVERNDTMRLFGVPNEYVTLDLLMLRRMGVDCGISMPYALARDVVREMQLDEEAAGERGSGDDSDSSAAFSDNDNDSDSGDGSEYDLSGGSSSSSSSSMRGVAGDSDDEPGSDEEAAERASRTHAEYVARSVDHRCDGGATTAAGAASANTAAEPMQDAAT